ncbi:hypothetical protein GF373_13010, partial [bacterium]|nr:hypothetical protein [bacterium]
MPNFNYRALATDGKIVSGSLMAANRPDAVAELKKQGVRPLELSEHEIQTSAATKKQVDESLKRARVPRDEIQVFTSQLAALLSAGIVLSQALAILEEQTENENLSKILYSVREDI